MAKIDLGTAGLIALAFVLETHVANEVLRHMIQTNNRPYAAVVIAIILMQFLEFAG